MNSQRSTTTKGKKRKRGPYFQHFADPSVDIPRTSSWRNSKLDDELNELPTTSQADTENDIDRSDTLVDNSGTNSMSISDEIKSDHDNANSNSNESKCPTLNGTGSGSLSDSETESDLSDGPDLHDEYDHDHEHDDDDYQNLFDMLDQANHEIEDDAEIAEGNSDTDDSDDDGQDSTSESKQEEPLYRGSRLTLTISMMLIATFVMKHGLSGQCIQDLLTLVELHCLSDNICCTSLHLYHKYFSQVKSSIEKHYYCANCFLNFIGNEGSCSACGHSISKATSPFFIVNPLSSDLKSAFARKDFMEKLKYREVRTKRHRNNIEDILDGNLYHEHFDGEHFHGTSSEQKKREVHISFQLNTDGVAMFKSTKTSLWPVYMVINEMHPKQRFSRTERIFLGVWYGKSKPFFRTFMKPFAETFKDVYHNGVKVTTDDGRELLVRGILLSVVTDSPARCLFQEFVQFNGAMGCPFCKAPGETVRTAGGGHTRAYPYNVDRRDGHYDTRTHDETRQDALEAHRTKKPVNGVKAPSWFLYVPQFDIVRCVAADYMHGLVLGVMKMLMSLWFDSSFHREGYSLSKKVGEVDERLNRILPPHNLSRMPRNIGTHIKFWKASEFRSFLLYYSVPCLWGILPEEYFYHFLLLNEASFILLSDSISEACLNKAEKLLRHFCLRIEALYGKRYQTWNMHSLLHYAQKVRDLGPLWANSCFWYEDYNGDLMYLFNGTRGIEMQIISAICLQQAIPRLLYSLDVGQSVAEFLMKLTVRRQSGKVTETICDGVHVVGSAKLACADAFPWYVLGRSLRRIYSFFRLKINGVLISCRKYRPGIQRNSYTVKYSDSDGNDAYGQIEYFVKCYTSCPNDTFCSVACVCQLPHYFAVLTKVGLNDLILSHDQFTGGTVPNIVPVNKSNDQQIVKVNVSRIKHVCMWIDIGKNVAFIGNFPNFCEKD